MGTGGDGMASAGVVLFLRLLGRSLCAFAGRFDLLELLVRQADGDGLVQAVVTGDCHQREYGLACLLQVHGIFSGDYQCRFRILL